MVNGFTELQCSIFNLVKQYSHLTVPKLCEGCEMEEEEIMPVVRELADVGYLRIDEGKNGNPDRVKPHPDRPRLLWQIRI